MHLQAACISNSVGPLSKEIRRNDLRWSRYSQVLKINAGQGAGTRHLPTWVCAAVLLPPHLLCSHFAVRTICHQRSMSLPQPLIHMYVICTYMNLPPFSLENSACLNCHPYASDLDSCVNRYLPKHYSYGLSSRAARRRVQKQYRRCSTVGSAFWFLSFSFVTESSG